MNSKIKEVQIGKKFGRLIILEYIGKINGHSYYKCQCNCGTIKKVRLDHLIHGRIRSCGCLQREIITEGRKKAIKHGKSRTRLYGVLRDMKTRCYNKNASDYKRYGGRGIKICDEWLNNYLSFEKWALENGYDENAPKGKCTIDRIDNDKGYSPENCRFITIAEQNRNKTYMQTKYGKEWLEKIKPYATLKRSEIAKRLGLKEGAVKYILRYYHTTLKQLLN